MVSRSVPNSLVATTIGTGMSSAARFPTRPGVSLTVVAILASWR
jgi:hypothetical protein